MQKRQKMIGPEIILDSKAVGQGGVGQGRDDSGQSTQRAMIVDDFTF
jgi:hypothetical protein